MDGHQSRFDLNFLRYINDKDTEWAVCIGVPYGTALWQVADSSEQNGTYKMRLSAEKKKLFEKRMGNYQQDLQLLRTDILPLVCLCWPDAFPDIIKNQKAILKRGWNPLNRNLLLHEMIRATMTTLMVEVERKRGLYPQLRLPLSDINTPTSSHPSTNYDQLSDLRNEISSNETRLNFSSGGMAQYVANTIIGEVDKQNARDRILARKTAAKSERDRILSITKKMSAGKLVLEGRCFQLNEHVLEQAERRHKSIQEEIRNKLKKNDFNYLELCRKANIVQL